ncbi:polysaccharide deacetylase family protein [Pseudobacteriovorax antillogorgiicola]|uniref:Polysaccharide deacetylase n=1 Tax=Pseudobacteriovorax antillogorgiicola TaxID=1513793 RepID=A0A1Y6BQH3_9BACT|nr:polysaccharide deacetylase family protein [Pseudobacteriovorax antillogorgiicola]TCS55390.1 polysaccharide deacetylase [Pseudobacteriovorax antillogorgiicola]SMF13130.1 Polysaccharide deacetylase [Pseudobacteriovorax antillogorgiicola]
MKCYLGICLAFGFLGCSGSLVRDSCISDAPGMQDTLITGQQLAANEVVFTVMGPVNDTALAISDVLVSEGIEGAFFVSGESILDRPSSILATIFNQGHRIANGSYSDQSLLSSKSPIVEVRQTDYLITPFTRNNIYLFRPPNLEFDQRLASQLNQAGLVKYVGPIGNDHATQSDIDCWSNDLDSSSCADEIFNTVASQDRGILQIHSSDNRALALSQSLVTLFKDSGYSFVSIDQVPDISSALQANGATVGDTEVTNCNDYD